MNWIKSVFISAFFVVSGAALVVGAYWLSQGRWLSGGGVALAGAAWAFYFARLYLFPVARNHPHLPVPVLLSLAGAVVARFGSEPWGIALAGLTAAGGLGYVHWYSRLGRGPSRLEVGAALPPFTVYEGDTPLTSDALRSALIIFYRGNWCPLCVAQIREVAGAYQALAERGLSIFLVSPQSAGHTAALAAKFQVPFRFLIDRENAAAQALGIAHAAGLPVGLQVLDFDTDTVLPTVIITDADGRVRWTHETDNYRARPEPAVFLEVLDRGR